ncbi:hypothetical protein I79_000084 [Cricetulus griseus]|uniref:Uncharacterized protein n=1 Tax=Cricetulus griseus TaxID=10029 RepID=G3GRD9_CRIGR|nr:hypothetical protein I79_000084 [Cricetulus griseus]
MSGVLHIRRSGTKAVWWWWCRCKHVIPASGKPRSAIYELEDSVACRVSSRTTRATHAHSC